MLGLVEHLYQNRLELKNAGAWGEVFFPPEAPLRRGGVGRSGRWAKNLYGALFIESLVPGGVR